MKNPPLFSPSVAKWPFVLQNRVVKNTENNLQWQDYCSINHSVNHYLIFRHFEPALLKIYITVMIFNLKPAQSRKVLAKLTISRSRDYFHFELKMTTCETQRFSMRNG